MSPARWAGLSLLAAGAVLLADFFSRRDNPSVTAADLGLLALLLGALMLVYGSFSGREDAGVKRWSILARLGWLSLAAGLLGVLAGFLLQGQVMCSCPAEVPGNLVPCHCGVWAYGLMLNLGVVFAVAGGAGIAAAALLPRHRVG